jgi:hypothetical protein
MKKYLFENFLNEPLIYRACRNYWEARLEDLFEEHKIHTATPYLNTKFANGDDFFNGNPIINYYFSDIRRAIRIIQEAPQNESIEIAAWIDTFETEDFSTKELVIAIQLRPKTEAIALHLITKWISDLYTPQKMERFIELQIELEALEVL